MGKFVRDVLDTNGTFENSYKLD